MFICMMYAIPKINYLGNFNVQILFAWLDINLLFKTRLLQKTFPVDARCRTVDADINKSVDD